MISYLRFTLPAIFILLSIVAHAQFTQFNHRSDIKEYVYDIATANNGNFCTVSSTGFRKYDAYGNLLWERLYNIALNPPSHHWELNNLCRLVHTDDDGFILFYMLWEITYSGGHVPTIGIYPAAMKIDHAGNLIWSKRYGHSYYPHEFYPRMNLVKIDARRMEGSTVDDQKYIFSLPGAPAEATDPPYNQGQTLNILSIDGNGNLLWNKKYRPDVPNDIVWEMPQTISFAGQDPGYGDLYYVSGERFENTQNGNNGWMFQLFIDKTGTIVKPYQRVKHHSEYNYSGHAVYDPANDRIMHSFSLCNTYITDGPEAVVTVVQSIDRSYNPIWYKLYWAPHSDHNYAYRIEKSKISDHEFVIAGMWNDWDQYFPDIEAINQVLLKINENGDPLFYKLYMRGEIVQHPSHAALAVNEREEEGSETYIFTSFSGARNYPAYPGPYYSRLIGTDINGEVCGYEDVALEFREADILYRSDIDYMSVDDMYAQDYPLFEFPTNIDIQYCKFKEFDGSKSIAAQEHRTMQAESVEIRVYPTLFNETKQQLLNIAFGDQEGAYTVTVYGIEGRALLTKNFEVKKRDIRQMNVEALTAGSYFVQISQQSGNFKKAFKVTKH